MVNINLIIKSKLHFFVLCERKKMTSRVRKFVEWQHFVSGGCCNIPNGRIFGVTYSLGIYKYVE